MMGYVVCSVFAIFTQTSASKEDNMGQFLAIGLATKISAEKAEAKKAGLDREQLQEAMREKLHYPPEIYTATDTDEFYVFSLKESTFQAELIPFLKTFYPLVYDEPVYYGNIVEKLEALPPSEWLSWAEGKPEDIRHTKHPVVKQFIHGEAHGPITDNENLIFGHPR